MHNMLRCMLGWLVLIVNMLWCMLGYPHINFIRFMTLYSSFIIWANFKFYTWMCTIFDTVHSEKSLHSFISISCFHSFIHQFLYLRTWNFHTHKEFYIKSNAFRGEVKSNGSWYWKKLVKFRNILKPDLLRCNINGNYRMSKCYTMLISPGPKFPLYKKVCVLLLSLNITWSFGCLLRENYSLKTN